MRGTAGKRNKIPEARGGRGEKVMGKEGKEGCRRWTLKGGLRKDAGQPNKKEHPSNSQQMPRCSLLPSPDLAPNMDSDPHGKSLSPRKVTL